MTAAQYDTLAVLAARIAAKSHGSKAVHWWNVSDRYSAATDRARTSQED